MTTMLNSKETARIIRGLELLVEVIYAKITKETKNQVKEKYCKNTNEEKLVEMFWETY